MLPLNIPELQVEDAAFVASVELCPPIAGGEGSVVTALFKTRQVDQIATMKVLGPNGQIETLSGTVIHPIWSVDRQDWVELGELQEGERLQAADGEAVVLRLSIHRSATPVYNIEIHGEHVYQAGKLFLLVHNADICTAAGRRITEHAVESLVRHGFKPPFEAVDGIIDSAKWIVRQADGATVNIIKEAGRGRNYSLVVEGNKGIVTAMKNLSPKELANLALNYGFPLPW